MSFEYTPVKENKKQARGLFLLAQEVGFGLDANFLPKIWPGHQLAVLLASKLAKHRSAVRILTRPRQLGRCPPRLTKNRRLCLFFVFARGQGFEPRYAASKATVLPLDDPRILGFEVLPHSQTTGTNSQGQGG